MTMYLNIADDGDRIAAEIGTPKGVADFTTWASKLPAEFDLVRTLAVRGTAPGSRTLREQLLKAIKSHKPNASARAVAKRLHEVYPHVGTATISDEPEDDELDNEE